MPPVLQFLKNPCSPRLSSLSRSLVHPSLPLSLFSSLLPAFFSSLFSLMLSGTSLSAFVSLLSLTRVLRPELSLLSCPNSSPASRVSTSLALLPLCVASVTPLFSLRRQGEVRCPQRKQVSRFYLTPSSIFVTKFEIVAAIGCFTRLCFSVRVKAKQEKFVNISLIVYLTLKYPPLTKFLALPLSVGPSGMELGLVNFSSDLGRALSF